jgi:hypothetical protein
MELVKNKNHGIFLKFQGKKKEERKPIESLNKRKNEQNNKKKRNTHLSNIHCSWLRIV